MPRTRCTATTFLTRCDGITAVDAFDATAILDFGGDRTRAIRELGARFGLIEPPKPAEQKALAAVLFRMIRRRDTQAQIEATAFAEGQRWVCPVIKSAKPRLGWMPRSLERGRPPNGRRLPEYGRCQKSSVQPGAASRISNLRIGTSPNHMAFPASRATFKLSTRPISRATPFRSESGLFPTGFRSGA